MKNENPTGCIYPKCKCKYRCKDLFSIESVLEVAGGICSTCKASTTLYNFKANFLCKNCIAEKIFFVQTDFSFERQVEILERISK